jgi:hypothetical protein
MKQSNLSFYLNSNGGAAGIQKIGKKIEREKFST